MCAYDKDTQKEKNSHMCFSSSYLAMKAKNGKNKTIVAVHLMSLLVSPW